MKLIKNETNNDFSIIFEEIEKYNNENPSFINNLISDEDLQNEKAIREFSDICQEINLASNIPVVYMTFS
jgi:hypothetical protein